MTSSVRPYRIHPRYKISTPPSRDETRSPDNESVTQSDVNLIRPVPSKSRSSMWPILLWVGVGTLIFVILAILIIVPIIVLANTGASTNTSISTTTVTTITTPCPTTSITTTDSSVALPSECTSSYSTLTDPSRSPYNLATAPCDVGQFPSPRDWTAFNGSGGSLLATCPIDAGGCGAINPGWYTGTHPSLAGDTKSGIVCFVDGTDECFDQTFILVTNCNGFYVYALSDVPSSLTCGRYCTV